MARTAICICGCVFAVIVTFQFWDYFRVIDYLDSYGRLRLRLSIHYLNFPPYIKVNMALDIEIIVDNLNTIMEQFYLCLFNAWFSEGHFSNSLKVN